MLSRLLIVRLKAAENALRDGRIDEAFRLASAPDIREHRRGAVVLVELADRFIERARSHFRADRFIEALSDLDRASMAGVRLDEIAEFRANVQTVADAARQQEARRRERLDAARRRVEAGSLVAGQRLIETHAGEDPEARRLEASIEQRRTEARELIRQAGERLDQGQLAEAVERLLAARRLDTHDEAIVAMQTRVCDEGVKRARRAIQEGRLSVAAQCLRQLGSLCESDPRQAELGEFIDLARGAAQDVAAQRYGDALRRVKALSGLVGGAKWVDRTYKLMRQIDEADIELKAGPLGRWAQQAAGAAKPPRGYASGAMQPAAVGGRRSSSLDETVVVPRGGRDTGGLPDRLLLLVDGAGSYLLLRTARCSVGRAASEGPADVALVSDLGERHAEIARVDEDYFIFGTRDIEIGGRRYRQQLLRDGDRVVLGRRAKFQFRLPSRKSLTATLALSDTTKMPNDVRHVILFKDHATIGPGSTAHIRCRNATRSLVLFERGGALYVRTGGRDVRTDQAIRVTLGEPVEMEGVSFVLEPWEVRRAGFA